MEFLLLLGPPGSGKGTLSRHLQEKDGFLPLSTGELIRQKMQSPLSSFGQQARPYMDRGDYIPDALALSLFFEYMHGLSEDQRIVLDGFPRTLTQAKVFTQWCEAARHRILGWVFLEIDLETARSRMQDRRVCERCRCPYHLATRPPQVPEVCDACQGTLIPREDDDAERMAQRLRRHEEQVEPLRVGLAKTQRILLLDGCKDPMALRQELSPFLSM